MLGAPTLAWNLLLSLTPFLFPPLTSHFLPTSVQCPTIDCQETLRRAGYPPKFASTLSSDVDEINVLLDKPLRHHRAPDEHLSFVSSLAM